MITENDVVRAVADHLQVQGYRIDRQLSMVERGIDIDAVHPARGERLLVEAKGATSSKVGSSRFGKPFSPNQAKSHVSVAFYCGAKLVQRHAKEGTRVALAFPDDKNHRRLIEDIEAVLGSLNIAVFFVDAAGRVNHIESSWRSWPLGEARLGFPRTDDNRQALDKHTTLRFRQAS